MRVYARSLKSIFLPLMAWVNLHLLLRSKSQNKATCIYGKVMRYCRSWSFKDIEIGTDSYSLPCNYVSIFYRFRIITIY